MRILVLVSLLVFHAISENIYEDPSIDNDAFKSVKQISEENGFIYEEYNITTPDNYILTLMRIPGKQ